ncbi:OmpA family protein [Rickettsiella endosymbiont of Miltochrista miniata]|uniref:OmpA family protein n=1 Tax=Rickettsiella endosymbiont of Miltochrista miniata TaxID=3066239 RepID=UPI00313C35F4
MKIISLFFYCVLTTALFAMVGCASSQSLDKAPIEKKTVSVKKKKDLPPPAIQIIQGADRLRVIAYSDVCFRPNGKLTVNCAQQLSQSIKIIKSYGDGLIQVVGYSDDLYDPHTAAAITQDQAEVITSFLWSHGIGSQRLRTIGYGQHDFIASNRNVKASSFNRRVEIILVKN